METLLPAVKFLIYAIGAYFAISIGLVLLGLVFVFFVSLSQR